MVKLCLHQNIFKVCLVIFQHYEWKVKVKLRKNEQIIGGVGGDSDNKHHFKACLHIETNVYSFMIKPAYWFPLQINGLVFVW